MSKSTLLNIVLLVAAAVVVYCLMRMEFVQGPHDASTQTPAPQNTGQTSLIEKNQAGQDCVRDAGNVLIPVKPYKAIISLTMTADGWLVACVGADRIQACSAFSNEKPYFSELKGKPQFADGKDIEALVQAGGDLIIMPSMGGDVSVVNRLREAGLTVFNIGGMTGLKSFNAYARQLAYLCDEAEKGEALLAKFNQAVGDLSGKVNEEQKKTALYLGVYGGQCYGGVRGSSYHDVIVTAGLRDCTDALEWGTPWPQYSSEQVIKLNPDYIITQKGSAEAVKRVPGCAALQAVVNNKIIEIDAYLINDPGLLMYDTARFIHEAVYDQ